MSNVTRRRALFSLLALLAVGPQFISVASSDETASNEPTESVGPFATKIETVIAGKPATLRLTGTAFRKRLGLKFYHIAGYCCAKHAPKDVDALAAADVPKQLILVLERDIPENILRGSFEAALKENDPQNQFVAEAKQFLDHVAAKPLKKGDKITLTHLPAVGMEVRVGEGETCRVAVPAFAHVVWNVYMGPQGVCPVLRKGLGERLATK